MMLGFMSDCCRKPNHHEYERRGSCYKPYCVHKHGELHFNFMLLKSGTAFQKM